MSTVGASTGAAFETAPGAAFEVARKAFTLRIRMMRAKIRSIREHASLVRLQPHYVYILGNSSGYNRTPCT